ncbi:Pyridine nucleotide-disulphide oxidoreductase [Cyclobacterium xiamenense]|uniref:Pyridine nucleotide-disulphide oxidoreductase n=1 Tax=Cyclobacterium xiamenense TaxID=1297121 RepID=A0A1H7A9P1_9BACT|nr:FAD-dependent oxidoreductase [Cyclobacterium xiamenense]SEJ61214.1 Pyridine nucleotide-disulphide oxidoreductase [Cyclobacterium xiamenense]
MSEKSNHIVIIGNGISGVTCARNVRKKDPEVPITLISAETEHFFSRTALMYIYMGHMKYEHTKPYADDFWEKNAIQLKSGWVSRVDFDNRLLHFQKGEELRYGTLILATGSKPNKFGWPGQDLEGVQGLYSYQDLLSMEKHTPSITRAVIVGGGLIGVEMAEMFSSRKIPVTFLVREKRFWDNILPDEEAGLVGRHIREHGVDLRMETELTAILDDGAGKVKAVETSSGEQIPCEFVGLTAGVSPNIAIFTDSELATNRGILVDERFRTNLPDVYAIGDCAEFKTPPGPDRKNIEQVWYTGRMHGETLAHNLTSKNPVSYKPGIWFNSAKFFDIEYQTYGHVPARRRDGEWSFYWEDVSGKIALRLLFSKADQLLGVNAFGWRMRHAFFDQAIRKGWPADKVVSRLDRANFNPEFYRDLQTEFIQAYNRETGKSLPLPKRSLIQRLIGSRA